MEPDLALGSHENTCRCPSFCLTRLDLGTHSLIRGNDAAGMVTEVSQPGFFWHDWTAALP